MNAFGQAWTFLKADPHTQLSYGRGDTTYHGSRTKQGASVPPVIQAMIARHGGPREEQQGHYLRTVHDEPNTAQHLPHRGESEPDIAGVDALSEYFSRPENHWLLSAGTAGRGYAVGVPDDEDYPRGFPTPLLDQIDYTGEKQGYGMPWERNMAPKEGWDKPQWWEDSE